MDPSQDFKSLQEKIQASLVSTTKAVQRIASEDLGFQRTVNPSTGERLEEQSTRLLSLSSDLLKSAAVATGQKNVGELEDAEDVDIQWRGIVDVIDGLLEKADICLDEYTGLVKRKSDFPENVPQQRKAKTNERLDFNFRRANIIKPQTAFEQQVDNFAYDYTLFLPSLTLNWTGKLPRELSRKAKGAFKHPYEKEILQLKYPETTYEIRDPIPYQPIDTTSATWVDTYEGVLEMLEELKGATEIAIDLEHHDYRSYHGLLSLMQISTREKDWIVDTLRPWRHKLEVLNEVFADPKIVKVFHGAFMDIIWLQRDLGLYIVGLFDTYHASSALGYPQRSLAYLLKSFVDFDADKKYQMADWRIRPLPEEMFYYARSDTHFLLYIYDKVRNELVERSDRSDPEKDLIEYTLQKSKETSLDRYTPFAADPETGDGARGWSNFLYKSHLRLSGEQFAVYRALHKWRDEVARRQDENPTFIMPPQVMMEIAKILPNDPKALWSLLGNSSSQKAKQSVEEIFSIVTEARKAGAEGPSTIDFFRSMYLDNRSVAAVAKRELGKEDKPELDLPPVEELRSEKSQLFGSIPLSSLWDGSSQSQNGAISEQIALPWTQFVQEAVDAASQQESQSKSQDRDLDMIPLEVMEKGTPAPRKDLEVDNTEFTLRQGQKRKLGDAQDEDSGDGGAPLDTEEMIALDVDEGGGKRDRRAKKKAVKEAKNARKQAKAGSTGRTGTEQIDTAEDEDAPFDYSQAQSVLNAKRSAAAANGTQDAPGRKKAFDPYAARMNAEGPKAARRMHGERTGKAGTFRK
ncbi:putative exosome complex exonuclease rrp [Diaporthe ampelina]|uniref:Putative exosome complex exonuclease rrp n=1 Tax=Diaporthe ampelina TaxID=1214573 RepID=A0A0G2FK60_9PEZI|nr:putative exosome complex exonuclease rrp [Diaporthe ampelina]